MEYYLIFIISVIIFSFVGLNLFSVLVLTIAAYAFMAGFDLHQLSFLLFNNAMNLNDKSEIVAIPFLLAVSEILVNFGYFSRLKSFLFRRKNRKFWPFFFFFILSSIPAGSSLIYNRILKESFSLEEFSGDRDRYLRANFFLSALSFIMPVSIPVIIVASLLNVSLKAVILYTLFLTIAVFILYYFIFIRKYLIVMASERKETFAGIFPVVIFVIFFFYLIYAVSFPVNVTAEIIFFTTLILVFLQNRRDFRSKLLVSIKNTILRSGVLISLVYLIGIINFFHIYTGASGELFDYLLFSFTNSSYLIISVFIIAFLLLELIDPLGILLILYPVYYSLLGTYDISYIVFIVSFTFFVSLGLMSNISGLPGNFYRNTYNLRSADIYQIFLFEYSIIVIVSFVVLSFFGNFL
ncbi:MAG: hypothetical protein FXF49_06115 [Flexistipes sinusarabici]|uniref:Uncharacterized protein n=1 Tax=Flexistipes sinusarabici TaxID=2352 RepID=A0A5D0MM56_FLESI|nr:hypothetical protein [Flexistipes sinusarabici]TYB33482.1 MAG: hypothetical protein FXF49_06115 [Flexistipes sinusarabici]